MINISHLLLSISFPTPLSNKFKPGTVQEKVASVVGELVVVVGSVVIKTYTY